MANENVIFRRGPSASIPEQKVPGTVLIETDTGNAFVDDTTENRIQITDTRLSVRIDDAISTYGYIKNGVLTGDLNASSHSINNLPTPSANGDAANKQYVDIAFTTLETELGTTISGYLPLKGGTMTGAISMGGSKITATYTPSTNNDLTNKEYVDTSISEAIAASDAMVFKGTIGTSGTVTQLPTSGYRTGWTYRVVTAGTYAGKTCEIGDMLIALNDGPSSGSSVINADWADVQANINGAVITPANLTTNQLVVGNNGQSEVKTLAAGANGQFLSVSSGTPSWTTLSLSTLGVTATATELNYMDGVTSNVQTQLNSKQSTIGTVLEKTLTLNNIGAITSNIGILIGTADTTGSVVQVFNNEVVIDGSTGGVSISGDLVNSLYMQSPNMSPLANELVTKAYVDSKSIPSSPGANYILVSTASGYEWTQTMPSSVIIDDGVVS